MSKVNIYIYYIKNISEDKKRSTGDKKKNPKHNYMTIKANDFTLERAP